MYRKLVKTTLINTLLNYAVDELRKSQTSSRSGSPIKSISQPISRNNSAEPSRPTTPPPRYTRPRIPRNAYPDVIYNY